MFLLSSSSSPETPAPRLPFNALSQTRTKKKSRFSSSFSFFSFSFLLLKCTHTQPHAKTITSGNNDHERDAVCSCGGCLCCTAALMLNWGKGNGKAERESDIFMLDGNPLGNVKKMIPLSLSRLYLEDAPHVWCLCACAFIHACAGGVLRRERSCSRIPLDGTC